MRATLLFTALVALAAPARAQCTHDDALARAASELILEGGAYSAERLLHAAHAAGSDAPTVSGLFTADGDATAWLARLSERGPMRCGSAQSERGTLWLAAPAAGHLEVLSADPLIVRASYVVEAGAATLFVLDAHGETTAFAVAGSPTDVELGGDVALPATLQLVAQHDDGPRPVAELSLGERTATPASTLGTGESVASAIGSLRDEAEALPLRPSHLLSDVAEAHAQAVCDSGRVAHVIEAGDAEERLEASGVRARHVGEVVARGADRAAAWRALVSSPSHHGALVDPRFTDAGVGEVIDAGGRTCLVVVLAAWPRRVR